MISLSPSHISGKFKFYSYKNKQQPSGKPFILVKNCQTFKGAS